MSEPEVKTVLYVPGFQKENNDVWRGEQIWAENTPRFKEAGFQLIHSASCYGGRPSYRPIASYGMDLKDEIERIRPVALFGHSMGCLEIQFAVSHGLKFDGPVVLTEGPNKGAAAWKLWLTGFPLERPCVQDMLKGSSLVKEIQGVKMPEHVLEIHGSLGEWWLSKDIFEKLPGSKLKVFPGVDHRVLPRDPEVVKAVLQFIGTTVGDI